MATPLPTPDFTFDPDRADLDAAHLRAPCVFDSLRVPCNCGRMVRGERYEFFHSTMFIYAHCPDCGPTRAIFAPPTTNAEREQQHAIVTENEAKALEEFLAYVAEGESHDPAA